MSLSFVSASLIDTLVAAEEDAIIGATEVRELLCWAGVGDGVREPVDEAAKGLPCMFALAR